MQRLKTESPRRFATITYLIIPHGVPSEGAFLLVHETLNKVKRFKLKTKLRT